MELKKPTPKEYKLINEENELRKKIRECLNIRDEDYVYMKRIKQIKKLLHEILGWK